MHAQDSAACLTALRITQEGKRVNLLLLVLRAVRLLLCPQTLNTARCADLADFSLTNAHGCISESVIRLKITPSGPGAESSRRRIHQDADNQARNVPAHVHTNAENF